MKTTLPPHTVILAPQYDKASEPIVNAINNLKDFAENVKINTGYCIADMKDEPPDNSAGELFKAFTDCLNALETLAHGDVSKEINAAIKEAGL